MRTMERKEELKLKNEPTAFPLTSFLAKCRYYHPGLEAKQKVNQQHNPEITHSGGSNEYVT